VPAGLSGAVAVAAGHGFSLALKTDGSLVGWGRQPAPVPDLRDVVAIDAGRSHALALRRDGSVVAWENNLFGQTNVPSGLSGVMAVAAGNSHSLALLGDGRIVAWGDSRETGVATGLTNVVAVAAGISDSAALTSDGLVVAWRGTHEHRHSLPPGLGRGVSLSVKGDSTVVVIDSGRLVIFASSPNQSPPWELAGVAGVDAWTGFIFAWGGAPPASPPVLRGILATGFVSEGGTAMFRVPAAGTPPLAYQWRHEGRDIPGATEALLVLRQVQPGQAGTYTVIVSNALGMVESAPVALRVEAVPAVEPTQWVTHLADAGPGSLRQCVLDANARPGEDRLGFQVAGELLLQSSLPPVTDPLQILGPGRELLRLNGRGDSRLLSFSAGVTGLISGLTLTGGRVPQGDGGGLVNAGSLTLSNVALVGNHTRQGSGGGVFNSGRLELRNSLVAENRSENYEGGGGAIFSLGDLWITNTVFRSNRAAGYPGWVGAGGGAIHASGTLRVSDSLFVDNAGLFGGALACRTGAVFVERTEFVRNLGGIRIGQGGALHLQQATGTISDTLVVSNLVRGGDGEWLPPPASAGTDGGSVGGAGLWAENGQLTVLRSAFVSNEGVAGQGGSGRYGGSGGSAAGGGLALHGGRHRIESVTIAGNRLTGGNAGSYTYGFSGAGAAWRRAAESSPPMPRSRLWAARSFPTPSGAA